MLEKIKFTDQYKTGISKIDEQHKQLFFILNKLITAMKFKVSNNVLEQVLKELTNYIDYHFNEEETLFKKYKYRNTDIHVNQHKYYIEKINYFNNKFQENKTIGLSIEILGFLTNWLKHHILELDMEYKNIIPLTDLK
jgi:hemerythrin-like metal-binding protein